MDSESPAPYFGRALQPKDDRPVSQSLLGAFGSSSQDIALDDAGNYHRLDNPGVKGWPMQPQRLSRDSFQIFFNICIDFISLLVPIPFFILVGSIALRDGKEVSEGDWRHVQYLIQLSTTAFPYAFGYIVGRTMKLLASWKLQQGATIGLLEQLAGSTTVGATLNTHAILRPVNFTTIALLLIWTFSPVGSRLAVSTISPVNQTIFFSTPVQYLDTSQETIFDSTDNEAEIFGGPINSIYSSSLMAPDSVKNVSMDIWGNVKIPYFNRLDSGVSANSSGWKSVPENSVEYSSILGVPAANVFDQPTTVNTSFTMTTTYLDLDCYNITRGPPVPLGVEQDGVTWYGTNTELNGSFFIAIDGYVVPESPSEQSHSISGFTNATNGTSVPHTLLFQSTNWKANSTATKMTLAYCSLNQVYVDSEIFCQFSLTTKPCRVTAMRPSTLPHAPSNITVLGFQYLFQMTSLLLPVATGEGVLGTIAESTAAELYIKDPSNTFSNHTQVDLHTVSKDDFEIRLGQVLNTYYLASISPFAMTGNLANGGAQNVAIESTHMTRAIWYRVNWGWLAVYVLAIAVMFLAAVVGVVARFFVVAPEVLGYVSSITRDNPYVRVPGGGSTLDGLERARLLKNVRVKIGDVGDVGGEAGYIAVGSEERVGSLMKGGVYS